MSKSYILYVKPFLCADCEEILGWERTWDDTMLVGTVNEACPRCGSHRIMVIPIYDCSMSSVPKEVE